MCQVWEGHWRVIPFHVLPEWLKDNDYLLHGHRPPMPSFRACFGSIFRIHTETGNIWTHLLGGWWILYVGEIVCEPDTYMSGFPPPHRADFIPLFGHFDHAAAQRVFHGPTAGESGVRDVLPGGCSLPQFLLALSHRLLPFWEGVANFLQVSSAAVTYF